MYHWVKEETAGNTINDRRLNQRMEKLLSSLSKKPDSSIPSAASGWAETQAAYRFLDNNKLTLPDILSGHRQATINRIKQQPVVLIAQDTTFLNYGTETEKLKFGTLRRTPSDHYLLHPSVAFTPSRINLGILDAKIWQRPEEKTAHLRDKKPVSEKESYRWLEGYETACQVQTDCPDTLIVNIADREGDIHDWFLDAQQRRENTRAHYIIRAKCNRRIENDTGEASYLWETLHNAKPFGSFRFDTPRNKQASSRKVTLSLTAQEVTLTGKIGREKKAVTLYAVLALEKRPPHNQKPIEWMLLTSLPVEDFISAQTVVGWYRSRWEIEIYFRVLKQGCKVQSLRLETDQRLENGIALYLIVSWRLHTMTMMSRDFSNASCTLLFTDKEWKSIYIWRKKSKPPKKPPPLRDIVRMLAQIGGFLARKGDGEPGVQTLWTGFQRLETYIEAMEIHESVFA